MAGKRALVIVKGGGELGTAVAHRLFKEGFRVVITEIEKPRAERRLVCFAEAVYEGEHSVEGVTARKAENLDEVRRILKEGKIPVLIDPEGKLASQLKPDIVVDARMAKRNLGTSRDEAKIVVGLGPGFKAGVDVDVVVETKPGLKAGEVVLEGEALPHNGVPYVLSRYTFERLLVAPASGRFKAFKRLGDRVKAGEAVGEVGGRQVKSRISGVILGLVHDGVEVEEGRKLGDVMPEEAVREAEEMMKLRGLPSNSYLYMVGERAWRVAEGVLKAIRMFEERLKEG